MQEPSRRAPSRRPPAAPVIRGALVALLGIAAAMLISCGSSGAGLIPTGNAGPLQSDFEAVAQAAQNGNGNCSATEAAILKTEHDFHTLPPSVSSALRSTLAQGIADLRSRALSLCRESLGQSTATSTTTTSTQTTQSTSTTPTATQTTPTQTTPTQTAPTTPTSTERGGGTPAPSGEPTPGGQGGTEPGAGAGAGGQEGGK